MGRAKVLRPHPDQQRAVGVDGVAGVLAHAVDHQAALFGGGGHHHPAGAHAEGIDAPPAQRPAGQLVIRRAQGRMPGETAVLAAIDKGAGMLNAHPHGKGLLLHRHAPPAELSSVSRAL